MTKTITANFRPLNSPQGIGIDQTALRAYCQGYRNVSWYRKAPNLQALRAAALIATSILGAMAFRPRVWGQRFEGRKLLVLRFAGIAVCALFWKLLGLSKVASPESVSAQSERIFKQICHRPQRFQFLRRRWEGTPEWACVAFNRVIPRGELTALGVEKFTRRYADCPALVGFVDPAEIERCQRLVHDKSSYQIIAKWMRESPELPFPLSVDDVLHQLASSRVRHYLAQLKSTETREDQKRLERELIESLAVDSEADGVALEGDQRLMRFFRCEFSRLGLVEFAQAFVHCGFLVDYLPEDLIANALKEGDEKAQERFERSIVETGVDEISERQRTAIYAGSLSGLLKWMRAFSPLRFPLDEGEVLHLFVQKQVREYLVKSTATQFSTPATMLEFQLLDSLNIFYEAAGAQSATKYLMGDFFPLELERLGLLQFTLEYHPCSRLSVFPKKLIERELEQVISKGGYFDYLRQLKSANIPLAFVFANDPAVPLKRYAKAQSSQLLLASSGSREIHPVVELIANLQVLDEATDAFEILDDTFASTLTSNPKKIIETGLIAALSSDSRALNSARISTSWSKRFLRWLNCDLNIAQGLLENLGPEQLFTGFGTPIVLDEQQNTYHVLHSAQITSPEDRRDEVWIADDKPEGDSEDQLPEFLRSESHFTEKSKRVLKRSKTMSQLLSAEAAPERSECDDASALSI